MKKKNPSYSTTSTISAYERLFTDQIVKDILKKITRQKPTFGESLPVELELDSIVGSLNYAYEELSQFREMVTEREAKNIKKKMRIIKEISIELVESLNSLSQLNICVSQELFSKVPMSLDDLSKNLYILHKASEGILNKKFKRGVKEGYRVQFMFRLIEIYKNYLAPNELVGRDLAHGSGRIIKTSFFLFAKYCYENIRESIADYSIDSDMRKALQIRKKRKSFNYLNNLHGRNK